MEWNNGEAKNTKKDMSVSSKILIGIIACIIVIIALLITLLITVETSKYSIFVDGIDFGSITTKEKLLTTINNKTYVNIEEFAKIVGYEYHDGEYKAAIIEKDKCYVEGEEETASFYLNSNKVYKLFVDELEEDYEEYVIEDNIISKNGIIYAPIEAIKIAFNVILDETDKYFKIYTLNYLVDIYDTAVLGLGYESIEDQSLNNRKALLNGYVVVKKEDGLYKVIDTNNNNKDIISARYKTIEFLPSKQEFLVANSSAKEGIINLDGTVKLQPLYDSIEILDKNEDLYLIEQSKKYGVVKSGDISIIYPEYDVIGLSNIELKNRYLILDTLIPVKKDEKWGAYNKKGQLVLGVEYDEFGYNLTSIEINGVKEVVEPVFTINKCNGIVVKKENKYGLIDIRGKELVPISVDGIYIVKGIEDENSKYFMLYNGKEINVIDRLIGNNLIETDKQQENLTKNEITENIINTTNNNLNETFIENNEEKNSTANITNNVNNVNN